MTDGHTQRLESALAGRYKIDRKLGEGGMASVYLALDLKHDRHVALKILRPELAAVIGAERFLTEIRRNTFGFIFQQFHLIRGISALENVMLPALTSGETHASLRGRALELLDMFGLSGKTASRIEWLSGGEAQRVTIARALMNDPDVVIADEPTAHLDTALSKDFLEIMARLNDKKKSILIASHDPMIYESPIVERVFEMRDGKILSPERPS